MARELIFGHAIYLDEQISRGVKRISLIVPSVMERQLLLKIS